MTQPHESDQTRIRLAGLCFFLFPTLFLLFLEAFLRPEAAGGLYFQEWSSEAMMQTVSITALRDEPLTTLWHLHIQPPAFDAVRAILAQVWRSDDPAVMLARVDGSLYFLWAILHGLTVFMVFRWLAELTNMRFAAVAAAFFSLHPALIYYATFLDGTLLTTFLVLCFCRLLHRIKNRQSVSGGLLALSFLSLFFTRSIFQWQWPALLWVSLVLMKFPRRDLIVFLAVTGSVVGLYTVKQASLFGLTSTSSFTGFNLCNSIGVADAWRPYFGVSPDWESSPQGPRVLRETLKPGGAINYNHVHYLAVNRQLQDEYRQRLLSSSAGQLATIYSENLRIYLWPSSRYAPNFIGQRRYVPNVIVDRLPHRSLYDFLFSSPVLPLLLVAAVLHWAFRQGKTQIPAAVGLFIPPAIIFLAGVIFERGENMRFKFFLEPVFFVFLCGQLYVAGTKVLAHARTTGKGTKVEDGDE